MVYSNFLPTCFSLPQRAKLFGLGLMTRMPGIRTRAHIAMDRIRTGCYTSGELVDLARRFNLRIVNPDSVLISKGTVIGAGTQIFPGVSIIGLNISICGRNSLGTGTHISGINIVLGEGNTLGNNVSISGSNIAIGGGNIFHDGIKIESMILAKEPEIPTISVGTNNRFFDQTRIIQSGIVGYSDTKMDVQSSLRIGSFNLLGSFGGCLITTLLHGSNTNGGNVYIGDRVALEKGAKVYGFSAIGLNQRFAFEAEKRLAEQHDYPSDSIPFPLTPEFLRDYIALLLKTPMTPDFENVRGTRLLDGCEVAASILLSPSTKQSKGIYIFGPSTVSGSLIYPDCIVKENVRLMNARLTQGTVIDEGNVVEMEAPSAN